MTEKTIIFPHQLFKDHPAVKKGRAIMLVEHPLFFGDHYYPLKFHKRKLVYLRAAMKTYQHYLHDKKLKVHYVDYSDISANKNDFHNLLKSKGISKLHYAETVDFLLEKRLKRSSEKLGFELIKYESPNFMNSEEELREYFDEKKSYFLTKFYIHQRKKFDILIEDGSPVGGKWSLDAENRKKLPKNFSVPKLELPARNEIIEEAKKYVEKNFPGNPGSIEGNYFPLDYVSSQKWLDKFLHDRFKNYGNFQDAIVKDESYLFHSLLTPMLNIGLLSPKQIIDRTLEYTEVNPVPLNSLEGFIRQILGWREFIRGIYIFDGNEQRTSNFFEAENKLPKSFYTGTTGIEPIDHTIHKLLDTGYNHHIERLMLLGNFMMLCEIHPTEVYNWFMEMYIDAYDWVMVPNVYGMSQFADAGLMSTKPYISSSNYVLKMSDYPKGEWCKVWDGLFWRFINKHKGFFNSNPRTVFMSRLLKKMDASKLKEHQKVADDYLKKLFKA